MSDQVRLCLALIIFDFSLLFIKLYSGDFHDEIRESGFKYIGWCWVLFVEVWQFSFILLDFKIEIDRGETCPLFVAAFNCSKEVIYGFDCKYYLIGLVFSVQMNFDF